MSDWDGNINTPHTMQDEYALRRELGATALTTDEDGQMIAVEKPDFVDVHVVLDWVIRVHGTSDTDDARNAAIDYIEEQPLQRMAAVLVHEDGVLCDGEWMTAETDENGNLTEAALTVALYPDGQELPTDVDVAVDNYVVRS